MVVRHNTLHCTPTLNDTGGGCTADLSLFGDFEPIRDVLVEDNLLKANASSVSYCAYGGHAPGKPFPDATGVVFTGNVFERGTNDMCGVYGPVTSFDADGRRATSGATTPGTTAPSSSLSDDVPSCVGNGRVLRGRHDGPGGSPDRSNTVGAARVRQRRRLTVPTSAPRAREVTGGRRSTSRSTESTVSPQWRL